MKQIFTSFVKEVESALCALRSAHDVACLRKETETAEKLAAIIRDIVKALEKPYEYLP